MKRLVIMALVLVIVGSAVFAGAEEETDTSGSDAAMPATQMMDGYSSAEAAGVTVQWKVEGSSISVQMSAPTTGWIAVGFDPSRQMADANIIIGYVEGGEVFLSDDYGVGNVRHAPDVENGGTYDLTDVEGEEADGMTVLRFTMPLDSGDATDKPLVAGSTYKIIAAHGPDGADDYGTYHGSRGSFETEL